MSTPNNSNQPQQGTPAFWGNQQPPQGQPFNPQYPSGQYPPVPLQGYPPQQYQQPPMMSPPTPAPKKKSRTGLIIGAVVLVVALALCGVVSSALSHGATATTGSTKVGNTTNATPTMIPTQATNYKVGDVVKVGDTWNVTLNSVKTSQGSSYVTPKTGNTFLILDVSMKNLSTQTQAISSVLLFTLRGDDGTKYDITIYPDAGSAIDGSVDAGQPAKGVMVYEVPSSVKSFHLKFASDAIDDNAPSATWNITT